MRMHSLLANTLIIDLILLFFSLLPVCFVNILVCVRMRTCLTDAHIPHPYTHAQFQDLVLAHFVPKEHVAALEERAVWDAERENWVLSKPDYKAINLKGTFMLMPFLPSFLPPVFLPFAHARTVRWQRIYIFFFRK